MTADNGLTPANIEAAARMVADVQRTHSKAFEAAAKLQKSVTASTKAFEGVAKIQESFAAARINIPDFQLPAVKPIEPIDWTPDRSPARAADAAEQTAALMPDLINAVNQNSAALTALVAASNAAEGRERAMLRWTVATFLVAVIAIIVSIVLA